MLEMCRLSSTGLTSVLCYAYGSMPNENLDPRAVTVDPEMLRCDPNEYELQGKLHWRVFHHLEYEISIPRRFKMIRITFQIRGAFQGTAARQQLQKSCLQV